ncbi:DUF998 domain-containing protein [Geodermatophilus sp. CPCC 206100]|uniref:DUF998 domain-containing protein n=1 Tax=Geodermatophilus sp. CPCC 206100 TaxID=3020054 RepID=UPI003B0078CA
MTASTAPTAVRNRAGQVCDRPSAVTRSLLGYGPLAAVVYLGSGLAQALTRDGFDLSRHALSLLANGPLGWIHVTTLVVTGLMTVAAAVGVRRALAGGRGADWGAGLLAGYGASLVAAGAFVADPMDGFPVGTPAGAPAEVTLSGVLHLAAGGLGFACLVASAWVLARRFAAEGRRGWARASAAVGVVVLAGFGGVASGSTSGVAVPALWIGVVAGWAWIAAVAVHLYRRTPHPTRG